MHLSKKSEQLPINIRLRGDKLNQVRSLKHLGSLVNKDGRCGTDIIPRNGMTKAAFGQLMKIMVSLAINIRIRIRVLKAKVWSVLLFGCEVWAIRKEMRKRLVTAQMWVYWRMLRVPWTPGRTNREVL